jgi:phosphoribosylformimino-5-aminoimidazole carboxamide ribotide isomerase
MKIIPAIDLLYGKCVRLSKGNYNTGKIYNEDPVEVAIQMAAHGIRYLHLVDLDGARSNHIVNHKILNEIVAKTNLDVDFGGGIKTNDDIQKAFECGATQITAGSIAVDQPELVIRWLEKYGADKIILGADCQNRMIATHGWLQQSSLDVITFIKEFSKKGVSQIICTDIAKDGMLEGPSLALYREIIDTLNVRLTASGGITTLHDLEQLKAMGCSGAIIGKAIYENRISLQELSTLC